MLFKMLDLGFWQQNHDPSPNHPRQLFVTQSHMLADKVEEYFTKLLHSLTVAADGRRESRSSWRGRRTEKTQA